MTNTLPQATTDEIAEAIDAHFASTGAVGQLCELGFGFGGKASGFIRRGKKGFGGKKRRAAFFAKLKDSPAGKILRFRAPSIQNLARVTSLKKKASKITGRKAVMSIKRKPLQAKRKVLRRGKYYSFQSKISRYGNPKVLGLGKQ